MTSQSLLIPASPAACLVGKFGGSTASLAEAASPKAEGAADTPGPAPETRIFAIGAFCVIKLPPKTVGPLFIGFNLVARPIELVEPLTIELGGASFT
jgi:hypothetical protein